MKLFKFVYGYKFAMVISNDITPCLFVIEIFHNLICI